MVSEERCSTIMLTLLRWREGEQFATINGDSDAFDIVEKVFLDVHSPSLGDRAGANPEEGFSPVNLSTTLTTSA